MSASTRRSSTNRRRPEPNLRARSLDSERRPGVYRPRDPNLPTSLSGRKNAMRLRLAGAAIAACCLLGWAGSASAHHGFNVEFDGTKCMDLKGTLTGVIWENPHAYLQMDVKDAGGTAVGWRLEMITPNALKRNGTTRQDFTANMGKDMNARACPAKVDGDKRGAAEYIKLSDGILRIVGQIPERGMTPDKLNF